MTLISKNVFFNIRCNMFNKIQPIYHQCHKHRAAPRFNLATSFIHYFKNMNFPDSFQQKFVLLPPLPAINVPSVFSVCSLLENNITITNGSSPSSAPKFTLAVRLSSAVKGARGGQMCSEIYGMLNVVGTQTRNYLSVWVRNGSQAILF